MDKRQEQQLKFGKALKAALKDKSMSMRGLALSAGLEYAHIQRIASGKVNLELTTILAIAEGFEITPSELFAYYK
jgi:transcriptional regulator with XRE-family HTH domain